MKTLLTLTALATLASLTYSFDRTSQDDEQARLEKLARGIEGEIAELRGQTFQHAVTVDAISTEGLVDYVKGVMAKEAELQAHHERMQKMLGLLDEDADLTALTIELLEEQVGGFYDPPTDTFYVMEGLGDDLVRVVMAHELVHALDDQHHSLDDLDQGRLANSDARLALHAVAEGSAMVLMSQWMVANMATLDMAAVAESQSSMGTEALAKTPDVLWKPLLASYLRGMMFLRSSGMEQNAALDHVYANPPLSSEQILHPKKYWNEDERDDPIEFELVEHDLPEGAEILHTDTFGELGLAILTTPLKKRGAPKNEIAMLGVRYTNRAAEGWGGDRWALVSLGEGHVLHLVTRWDTGDDAEEFHDNVVENGSALNDALGEGNGHLVERNGETVMLTTYRGVTSDQAKAVAAGIAQEQSESEASDG
tara:strand:- start:19219 stop:20490 length:1272 start_codon:yes stop_codon:yes gene_type:complete